MSSLHKRPDYINYGNACNEDWSAEDISKFNQEPVIEEWEVPRAFICKDSPLWFHFKISSPLGVPLLFVALLTGFSPLTKTLLTIYIGVCAPLYYLTRSNYYDMKYKITKSGILSDELKVYPKWRYGRQDPTKMMALGKPVAVICIILAILVNPMFLAGAGGAAFMAFQNNYYIDDGQKAYKVLRSWHGDFEVTKINSCSKRFMININTDTPTKGAVICCTAENFERIKLFITDLYPDVENVEEPFDF